MPFVYKKLLTKHEELSKNTAFLEPIRVLAAWI